jgi:hypothetical protein
VVVVLVLMTRGPAARDRERDRELVEGLSAWAGEHGWDVGVGAAAGGLGLVRAAAGSVFGAGGDGCRGRRRGSLG